MEACDLKIGQQKAIISSPWIYVFAVTSRG